MKIFDKLFKNKIFNPNNDGKIVDIYAPIYGQIIPLSDIPDEAFSSGAIGDGVGIEPSADGDIIHAPCDAEDVSIFDTLHAVSFDTKEELEIIVHFGVDTVTLNGKGFKKILEIESSVKKGEKLVSYNLEYIKKKAKSHKTPILISNMDMVESIEKMEGKVKPGDLLMRVRLK